MKKRKKLFILRGLPASGKSSWAMNYVNEHPKASIILSKDGIRDMLGIYWVNEREPLISRIFILLLKDIVTHGRFTFSKDSSWNAVDENMDNVYDIIIDNELPMSLKTHQASGFTEERLSVRSALTSSPLV